MLLLVCFLVSGCSDTFEKSYPSYSDAVSDGAVLRGWVPEGLPNDAFHIVERHNIDNNRGYGFFYFKKENLDAWTAFFNQDKCRLTQTDKLSKMLKPFRFFSDNHFALNMEAGDWFADDKFVYWVHFQEYRVAFFTINATCKGGYAGLPRQPLLATK